MGQTGPRRYATAALCLVVLAVLVVGPGECMHAPRPDDDFRIVLSGQPRDLDMKSCQCYDPSGYGAMVDVSFPNRVMRLVNGPAGTFNSGNTMVEMCSYVDPVTRCVNGSPCMYTGGADCMTNYKNYLASLFPDVVRSIIDPIADRYMASESLDRVFGTGLFHIQLGAKLQRIMDESALQFFSSGWRRLDHNLQRAAMAVPSVPDTVERDSRLFGVRYRGINIESKAPRNDGNKFIVFTAGGGGSGKGRIISILKQMQKPYRGQNLPEAYEGFVDYPELDAMYTHVRPNGGPLFDMTRDVHIDCDDIKLADPKFKYLKDQGYLAAATAVHVASVGIATDALKTALKMGHNIIYDSTFANTGQLSLVDMAKKHGYTVVVIGATTEPGVALPRTVLRGFQTGRHVPMINLLSAHINFSNMYPQLLVNPQIDFICLYDNTFVTKHAPMDLVSVSTSLDNPAVAEVMAGVRMMRDEDAAAAKQPKKNDHIHNLRSWRLFKEGAYNRADVDGSNDLRSFQELETLPGWNNVLTKKICKEHGKDYTSLTAYLLYVATNRSNLVCKQSFIMQRRRPTRHEEPPEEPKGGAAPVLVGYHQEKLPMGPLNGAGFE